jgi:DNA polymerase-1
MKRLVVIDAHSIIHRAFHALPPLSAPDGRPIQAVYGLARILLSIIDRAPDYLVAASDTKDRTFRKEAFEQYKAHRAETPDDLTAQMDEAKELFRRLGIPFFDKKGVEADDIIATIVEKFASTEDLKIEILSSDSDLFQLVQDDHVVIHTFKKGVGDTIVYDDTAVRERYGLAPVQMIDYKALVGDVSDNVPGLPGIGPKTAATLLQAYGSIDVIYKNLQKLPEAQRAKFEEYRKQLELGRMLITLKRDVSIPLDSLEALKLLPLESDALAAYFEELGFTSLVRQVQKKQGSGETTGLAGTKRPRTSPRTAAKKKAPRGGLFGADMGVDFGAAASTDTASETTGADEVVVLDEATLHNNHELASDKPKVGFDIKTMLQELWADGRDIAPPYADLGIAYWLLHPDLRAYEPDIIFGAVLKRSYNGTPEDLRFAYHESQKVLAKNSAKKLYDEIEMPILRVLAEMERWGIYISDKKLQKLEKEMRSSCEDITAQIYTLAGGSFNLNSPKQVSEVLFDKLNIGTGAKGKKKTNRSTRADVLDELREAHPIVPLLLKYREDFKMLSTYAVPLQALRDEAGVLHTEYLQTGTATGRISSRAPNLQNIPQGSAWSKPLRSAFEARPGHTLVAYDYSQLELRIMASLADDPAMKAAFAHNEDIHRRTAAVILGKQDDAVTKEERRIAKTLNFGLAYGMGVRAFAKESGLSQKEAQGFIDRYFERFSRVRAWQEQTKEFARTHGYVETVIGRRRYFRELQALHTQPHHIAEAERAAINHPVQGSEADIVKLAMLKTKDLLIAENAWGDRAKMLLNIHDELVFEVRDDAVGKLAPRIRATMEEVFPALGVPLKVDVNIGKDWGDLQPLAGS